MAIPVSGKFKPMGIGGFAVVDAEDVEYNGGRIADFMPVPLTQEDYDALVKNGTVTVGEKKIVYNENTPYLIVSDEK